jgi:hypothetical protein
LAGIFSSELNISTKCINKNIHSTTSFDVLYLFGLKSIMRFSESNCACCATYKFR